MDKTKSPLKVALYGMDGRSYKMMSMYLQGPCRGAAVVVNDIHAECDIFDADTINGQQLLQEHLANKVQRPLIVLSLHEQQQEKRYRSKKAC
ncbi:hypothetical protein [Methylocucumis oryzae]|uniref:hypothetical protein n=1 Tax=Methylocucumis oryzae TaxID=1632867 RepID=UPI001EF9F579|nr:hypothetical protein [Methylocucumis oryzae]